ncbi:flavin reductase family protein [Ferrimonas sp.]|uniref:flavin reductase family protein n=1 Tax=Ferrimonas sp. TaxID=2080861 RepID=UPI003A92E667
MLSRIDETAMERMAQRYRAHFVNSLSGYKSANLIGSISPQGLTNLAIVSSVFHLGADPPLMGLIMRPHSSPRHSLENIEATGCFTINQVHQSIHRQAHQSSARYPRGESEFDAVGLTPRFGERLIAPYVAESRLSMGMELVRVRHLEENDTLMVSARIVEVWLDEVALAGDGHLHLEHLDTVTVSGLDHYHKGESLGRLAYAKPDRPPLTLEE